MESWCIKYCQNIQVDFATITSGHQINVFLGAGMKDVIRLVALPGAGRQSCVGIIDMEKGVILDVITKKIIKIIPSWDGSCTSDGKYGLYAPQSGEHFVMYIETPCIKISNLRWNGYH